MISSLTVNLGLFYLLMAAIAWWVLRASSVHLAVKIVVPVAVLALVCATWFTIPEILGFPLDTAFTALPTQAELIGFVPHEDEKRVDVWLIAEGQKQPRAYSIELTESLKDTLRKAQKAQAEGGRAVLAKGGQKKRPPGYTAIDGGSAPYELLPNAFNLPAKGAAQ